MNADCGVPGRRAPVLADIFKHDCVGGRGHRIDLELPAVSRNLSRGEATTIPDLSACHSRSDIGPAIIQWVERSQPVDGR
jgi:hypothetical protein